MRKHAKALLRAGTLGLSLLLGACAQNPADYAQAQPRLDLVQFFGGHSEAWGMFQKRDGTVARRFHVRIDGQSQDDGQKLILDERFRYDDGQEQQRVWTLVKQADGRWIGTAGDVQGQAIGEVSGNAFHWQYVLRLPVGDKTYDMHMDDWMYLIDEKTMANRASMRKFGLEVGQVTLFFRKGG